MPRGRAIPRGQAHGNTCCRGHNLLETGSWENRGAGLVRRCMACRKEDTAAQKARQREKRKAKP